MASPLEALMPDILPGRIFHMAFSVGDLRRAMGQVGSALDTEWNEPRNFTITHRAPGGRTEVTIEATYSRVGPPYIELIQGPARTFFAPDEGERRIHHAGIIVEDVGAEARRLEMLGMTIAAIGPGDSPGGAFLLSDTGLRLELMSSGVRGILDEWFRAPPAR